MTYSIPARATIDILVTALAAALALLCLSGCQSQSFNTRTSDQPRPEDIEFAKGSERPPTPQTLYAMARLLIKQNRSAEAQSLLAKIIRQDRRYLPAYVDLAQLQLADKQAEAARQTLEAALAVSPEDPVLLNDLGMVRMSEEDYGEAAYLFSRATAVDARNPRYQANMAAATGMAGRYDQCLETYLQIMSPADAHHNLAVICQARGDAARAEKEAKLAKDLAAVAAPGQKQVP